MKSIFTIIASLLLFPFLFSCYSSTSSNVEPQKEVNFNTETTDAVDDLLSNCTYDIDPSRPIIVASLVDINDVRKSSSFGRMSSEIIANRIAQHGYKVKELKMSQSQIFIKQQGGEFVLSRDVKEVANKHNAQSIVVGTYVYDLAGHYDIHICLKIIDPVSNVIGCSTCYISNSHWKNWQ